MKIIPAIDLMEGKVVRLVKGKPENKTVYSENPMEIAKKWQEAGADMIHIVDLDATLRKGSNFELIKKISGELAIPVQVAGGLRDEKKISESLDFAQRVVLGTLAFKDKETLQKILKKFGKERIVVSVDHVDGTIVIEGWQKNTKKELIPAIKEFIEIGVSNFLMTNVTKDGTLEGPDVNFLSQVCKLDKINVIASGGISSIDDISKVKNCNSNGVILGKALYENLVSIEEAKKIA